MFRIFHRADRGTPPVFDHCAGSILCSLAKSQDTATWTGEKSMTRIVW